MDHQQKTRGSLFIVGAGPGIGKATAERFGKEGWKIVLSSRNPRNLDPLVSSLVGQGIDAHGLILDTTDPVAVRASIRNADRLTGGLTTVLYNAAFVRQQDLFTMSDAEIASDVAVNITGGLNVIRAAVEQFANRPGMILVTGGGLAVTPHASYASLGLGKAALRNVVEGLVPDLALRNIRISMATVATLVSPESTEAHAVGDLFWNLATDAKAPWEAVYPNPTAK